MHRLKTALGLLRLAYILMLFSFVVVAGCGDNAAARRVDGSLAYDTLDAVLKSWKQGETPDTWRSKIPEVVVQDMDWTSGAKLKDYKILDNGKPLDANLYCNVKLTLEDSQQREVVRSVTYVIGTKPVITVFRGFGL